MQKSITTLLLSIFCIVCVVFYLKYDNQRYDYGHSCTFCERDMPYNIEPKYVFEYPQRYYLLDEDKFELLGDGFKFHGSSFKIKDFLGYGYNHTSIIAKCTDSVNNIKYLISYKTLYLNSKGNPEISFKDLKTNAFIRIKKDYNWVNLNEDEVRNITFKRFLSFVGVIVSILSIIGLVLKSKKV